MNDSCRVVREYLDAFWTCRWEKLRRLLAPDALYEDPLLPEPVRGRDAILDVLAYCHAWGQYRGEVRSLFGSPRLVAVELRIRGVVIAPPEGMSVAVLGKEFDFAEADVFELDGRGLVIRQSIYADALGLSLQLGEPFV